MVSNYEGFIAKHNERITNVFERFNKMINNLQLHEKYDEIKEVNLNIRKQNSATKEGRYLSNITLETLYGVLKTYEIEPLQMRSIQDNRRKMKNISSALIFFFLLIKKYIKQNNLTTN